VPAETEVNIRVGNIIKFWSPRDGQWTGRRR
jgi:hypothetical protein